jgi:hypothetical protein
VDASIQGGCREPAGKFQLYFTSPFNSGLLLTTSHNFLENEEFLEVPHHWKDDYI